MALQWGWNKEQFLHGDAEAQAASLNEQAETVDMAVSSSYWWSWLLMLEKVAAILRKATFWIEACPCHAQFLQEHSRDDMPAELYKAIMACPMRCRRAPELACGELVAVVHAAAQSCSAELLSELPRKLSAGDRRSLLQEMDLARAHICFYMSAKLRYVTELPWAVVGIAHFDRGVAEATLRAALQSLHPHNLLRRLRGELLDKCRLFLKGAMFDSFDVRDLAELIGAMRMIPTSERPIGGQHAKTHKRGMGRQRHTEAFVSYGLRSPELRDFVENRGGLHEAAHYLKIVSNPKRACEASGRRKPRRGRR